MNYSRGLTSAVLAALLVSPLSAGTEQHGTTESVSERVTVNPPLNGPIPDADYDWTRSNGGIIAFNGSIPVRFVGKEETGELRHLYLSPFFKSGPNRCYLRVFTEDLLAEPPVVFSTVEQRITRTLLLNRPDANPDQTHVAQVYFESRSMSGTITCLGSAPVTFAQVRDTFAGKLSFSTRLPWSLNQ